MDTMEEICTGQTCLQLQKDLESASDTRPTTLAAAWLCLDKLATSTAEMVANIDSMMPRPRVRQSGGRSPLPGNVRMPSMS